MNKLVELGLINVAQPPHWADALMALMSILTLGAVGIGVRQIYHVNQQMHREFETQYLLRFWQLMDRRSNAMRAEKGLTKEDELLLLDYFSLSEDQIALRGLGRVTQDTWNFWRSDIKSFCEKEKIKEVLNNHPESFPHLNKLQEQDNYDPLPRFSSKRFWL